jgi:hypothetical protein
MTKDDIIKMARETGMELYGHGRDQTNFQFILCRFANAIAAAEREACAKVCDGIRYSGYCPPEDGGAPRYYNDAAEECAAAIRARGNQ